MRPRPRRASSAPRGYGGYNGLAMQASTRDGPAEVAGGSAAATPAPTAGQRLWRAFCRLAVRVFYRRFEIAGSARIAADGPLILCANHVNALVDAVVVQAACSRPLHPLARSGLFRRPLLRPILRLIQAVPIYRRRADDDARASAGNDASFSRLFDYLRQARTLLIFPEGQSHSDPSLRPIKTGAARIALGAWRDHGRLPQVLPVGLIFTRKGRFRGDVLVQVGKPVVLDMPPPALALAASDAAAERTWVLRATEAISRGLFAVTLNVESWEDVALLGLVRRFAAFRGAHHARRDRPRPSLARRYRAFQRLYEAHRWLRVRDPERVAALRTKLRRFERLCRRYGVQDYHLNLRYRPVLVLHFLLRTLAFAVLVFPLALWGWIHSAVAYLLTRELSKRAARGRDQYDSASMLFGLPCFALLWGAQTAAVWHWLGLPAAIAYASSLPFTAAVALWLGRERRRIVENVRVFFLFVRQRRVRDYLHQERSEVETELARLATVAKKAVAITEPAATAMPQPARGGGWP